MVKLQKAQRWGWRSCRDSAQQCPSAPEPGGWGATGQGWALAGIGARARLSTEGNQSTGQGITAPGTAQHRGNHGTESSERAESRHRARADAAARARGPQLPETPGGPRPAQPPGRDWSVGEAAPPPAPVALTARATARWARDPRGGPERSCEGAGAGEGNGGPGVAERGAERGGPGPGPWRYLHRLQRRHRGHRGGSAALATVDWQAPPPIVERGRAPLLPRRRISSPVPRWEAGRMLMRRPAWPPRAAPPLGRPLANGAGDTQMRAWLCRWGGTGSPRGVGTPHRANSQRFWGPPGTNDLLMTALTYVILWDTWADFRVQFARCNLCREICHSQWQVKKLCFFSSVVFVCWDGISCIFSWRCCN